MSRITQVIADKLDEQIACTATAPNGQSVSINSDNNFWMLQGYSAKQLKEIKLYVQSFAHIKEY